MHSNRPHRAAAYGLGLFAAATVGLGPTARAELCAQDAVPAATLLLPYFEVDVTHPSGVTTVVSINNAVAARTSTFRVARFRRCRCRSAGTA
jgi:hypothetical protein